MSIFSNASRASSRRPARASASTYQNEHAEKVRAIQRCGMLYEIYFPRQRVAIKGWPVRERIRLLHLILRTGHHVYHTTGFDREEIIDLCIRINSAERGTDAPNWPPCLGLFKSVAATLTYMEDY